MIVSSLRRYPVKSLGCELLDTAVLEPQGLQFDRRWVLLDEAGTILTQREVATMALIDVRASADGLHFPDLLENAVPWPEGPPDCEGSLWGTPHALRLADASVSDTLSRQLDRPVRLAFQCDPQARRARFDGGDSAVNLADDLPLLITTEASLEALNSQLSNGVPMDRFRPNIVIADTPAWDEDHWLRLRVGGCILRVTQKCTRCIIVTINPKTARRPNKTEPLRTLARLRKHTGAPTFGVQAVIEQTGSISAGDTCEILERHGD
jgi:uncharacterized protein